MINSLAGNINCVHYTAFIIWRHGSRMLRSVCRTLSMWNCFVSPQAFPRLALSLCMPPTGWWRGTDTSLPCSTLLVELFNSEWLEVGESLLFATLVKDLRKAVHEWKEYPALPCTGRKHERKSVNPPGLDCGQPLIVGSHTASCIMEYLTNSMSSNPSYILVSYCLHVYLKELIVKLV